MNYLTQKIDKKRELEERITDYTPISITHGEYKEGKVIEVKRVVSDDTKELKAGDRIIHSGHSRKTGKSLYSDPNFWN